MWRHETEIWDRPPPWWLWGDPAFRGWVRAMPVALPTTAAAVVAVLLYGLGGEETGLLFWIGAPFIIVTLACMILCVTVFAYNWPKALVPPHLRSEPGFVEAMAARKRSDTG